MYKYLPTKNNVALKTSLNKIISDNNISSNKISKAIGVDTSHLKVLRDPNNIKMEISPDQYMNLLKYLAPKKVSLDLGKEPKDYFDKFMFYLFKKGYTFDEFCSRSKKSKTEIKSMFTKNGVSSRYRDTFISLLNDEEFNSLNSYTSIVLSNDRDGKVIKSINNTTLINVFMVKRGFVEKDLAIKAGYNEEQVKSILQGFITDSGLEKMSKALRLPLSTLDNVILNSWDTDNNFGYFLQKTILEKRYNIYSISSKIGMEYSDLKGIVSGSRNIKEDEYDKIALCLNIDPDELRIKAPHIIEGDDKFIPWNFIKWVSEHPEVTYKDMNKAIGKDSSSLITRIKNGLKYTMPPIDKIMTLTGLTKDQLRETISDKEIEALKSTKKKSGRKYKGDPNSFDMFVRNHIDEKGITLTEFCDLIQTERTTFCKQLKDNRIREDILENVMLTLDISKEDIKKFKVNTFKNKTRKSVVKENTPVVEESKVKETPVVDSDTSSEEETIKFLAKSIFLKIKDGKVLPVSYSSQSPYVKLMDNPELRIKVTNYINILLIDNMMADSEVIMRKDFTISEDGGQETILKIYLKCPYPDFNSRQKPEYHPTGDKSLYESMIDNKDILIDHLVDLKNTDKDLLIKEINEFLELLYKLKDEYQCTILRIMNLVKNPEDINMENIPEECFSSGRFGEYKRIDTMMKLISLDK